MTEEYVLVSEAAERYEVSEKTIRQWAKDKKVKSHGEGSALTISDEGMPPKKSTAVTAEIKTQSAKDLVDTRPEVVEARAKEAVRLSEMNIKSADELEGKHKLADDKQTELDNRLSELNKMFESFNTEKSTFANKSRAILKKLTEDSQSWERQKATEKAEIERLKVALDNRESELDKREKGLDVREELVGQRELQVAEDEKSLTAEARRKREREDAEKDLGNRLAKGDYKKYNELMNNCLDVLHKYGEKKFVYRIEDELNTMWKLAQNNLHEHLGELEESMKTQMIELNQKAVKMARLPKEYPTKSWNEIVDNLEIIWKLIPGIRPPDIPIDDEGITADMPNKNINGGKTQ